MKVSKQLPQFQNESAIMVVTGKQGAEFYIIKDSEISLHSSFEIKTDRYSDRAGFFARKGGVSGAVKEKNKEQQIKEFLRQLKIELDKIITQQKLDKVYVYAPTHLMRRVREVVKKSAGKSYAMSFTGNYLKAHETELLKMISARTGRRAKRKHIVPITKEAVKVLRRKL